METYEFIFTSDTKAGLPRRMASAATCLHRRRGGEFCR